MVVTTIACQYEVALTHGSGGQPRRIIVIATNLLLASLRVNAHAAAHRI